MAHVKIISAAGWDFGGPTTTLIKKSSRGLIGNDRADFLKFASHAFLPVIDQIKLASGEVPVHSLAIGAYEKYGLNRNGDGFDADTCRSRHHTFKKFAKAYRNHENKDPSKSYGIIKESAYNEAMHRIELLVAYNATKEAAERNNGFIADKELEKIAKGESIPGSMACRLPFDQCTFCKHSARNREEYCTPTMCKAGGCKQNLTRLIKVGNDVHHLGVMNPNCTYFDWSNVWRPADRIAYGAKADWLTKAASENYAELWAMGGSKMAEDLGVTAPLAVLLAEESTPGYFHTAIDEQVKLAYGLAHAEKKPELIPPGVKVSFSREVQGEPDISFIGEPGTQKCAESLTALADEKVILHFRDFARLSKKEHLTKEAMKLLPGAYDRMIEDGSLERNLTQNRFGMIEKTSSEKQKHWARINKPRLTLEKSAVDRRCMLAAVRGVTASNNVISPTSSTGESEKLVREYALYKCAALWRTAREVASQDEFLLTALMSIAQNTVC